MKTLSINSTAKSFKTILWALPIFLACSCFASQNEVVMEGEFKPAWESLSHYNQAPDWFRDAKFGIWAHWGPQCEPESGDWYARDMYLEGSRVYNIHLKKYGHPSEFGFKDIIHRWKAKSGILKN